MQPSDPISEGLNRSFSNAAKSIRPKARSAQSGTGLFGSKTISISIKKGAITPKRQTIHAREVASTEIIYEMVLPDSDRAKKLSRKTKEDRKKKRKATKASKCRNRK